MKTHPILPAQAIKQLIYDRFIVADLDHVQACSLDVSVKLSVDELLNRETKIKKGHLRFFEIKEKFRLPKHIKMQYSSRSTTARNFVECDIEEIFCKKNISICPLATDIKIYDSQRLGQMYFYDTRTMVESWSIDLYLDKEYFTFSDALKRFSKCDIYHLTQTRKLHKSIPYLMRSSEPIKIANDEVGILQVRGLQGDYCTHIDAGFFDAGFEGRAVFEVIANEDVKIDFSKPFARLDIIPLTEATESPYNGNYQGQDDLESILPKIKMWGGL